MASVDNYVSTAHCWYHLYIIVLIVDVNLLLRKYAASKSWKFLNIDQLWYQFQEISTDLYGQRG